MIGLSNTHVNNTANATAEDKCYCHIFRSVQGIVELDFEPASPTQRQLSSYSVSLEIMISASCQKEDEYEVEPRILRSENGNFNMFMSGKQTVCRDIECECDTVGQFGGSHNHSTVCLKHLHSVWNRVSIGPVGDFAPMPDWAEMLVSTLGGTAIHAEMVASRINTEEQHGPGVGPGGIGPGSYADLLGFGPYDTQGHPKNACASLKGKNCCAPFDSSPGVVSGGGGGGFGIGLNT